MIKTIETPAKGDRYQDYLEGIYSYKSRDLLGQQVTVMMDEVIYAGVVIYNNNEFFEMTNIVFIHDTGSHESKDNLRDADLPFNVRAYHSRVHCIDNFVKRIGGNKIPTPQFDLTGKRVLFYTESYYYEATIFGEDNNNFYVKDPIIIYETGYWDEKYYLNSSNLSYSKIINKKCVKCIFLGVKEKK